MLLLFLGRMRMDRFMTAAVLIYWLHFHTLYKKYLLITSFRFVSGCELHYGMLISALATFDVENSSDFY